MSFFGLWMVTPLPDEQIARLAPVLLPVIERQAALPHIRARWQRWASAPEQVHGYRPGLDPDNPRLLTLDESSTAFLELSSACPLNEEEPYNLINEVWHLVDPDASLVVTCRRAIPQRRSLTHWVPSASPASGLVRGLRPGRRRDPCRAAPHTGSPRPRRQRVPPGARPSSGVAVRGRRRGRRGRHASARRAGTGMAGGRGRGCGPVRTHGRPRLTVAVAAPA